MIKRISIVLLACVVLASCGFHLRGKYEYADALKPIFIVSEDRDFIYELEEVFDFSDLEVVGSISAANAILEFTSEEYERKPITLDDRGRATRYRLQYTSRYRVLNRTGDALLLRASTKASRVLDYDPSQVLQADSEEEFLKEEMYDDMAQAVARRVARISGEVVASAEALQEFEAELRQLDEAEKDE